MLPTGSRVSKWWRLWTNATRHRPLLRSCLRLALESRESTQCLVPVAASLPENHMHDTTPHPPPVETNILPSLPAPSATSSRRVSGLSDHLLGLAEKILVRTLKGTISY